MIKWKKAIISLFVFLSFFVFINSTQAQVDLGNPIQNGINSVDQNIGLSSLDLPVIVFNIIRQILGLLSIILLVIVIYAGFLWMLSGGDEEKRATARKTLINAIIGIVIIFSANSIASYAIKTMSSATNFPNTELNP